MDLSALSSDLGQLKILLLSVKDELKTDISQVKAQNDMIHNDIESALEDVQKLKKENDELKSEVIILKNNLNHVNHELKQQSEKIVQLELYNRKENLIVYGVRQDSEENCLEKIINVFKTHMDIGDDIVDSMKIDRCHRLPGAKPQPIIVRFNWYQDRSKVWDARFNLKGSKISVSEDFPSIITQRRKSLFPIMMEARNQDHFAYLKEDKLVIDKKTYTIDSLHTLPPQFNPARMTTKQYDDVTAFFGGSCPLSNFYQSSFEIDGKEYFSVEPYFQLQKCIFAEDLEAVSKVNQAKSFLLCKKIGDSVSVDKSEWLPNAKIVMRKAMEAKFNQNEHAKKFLIDTGNKTLAEATTNKTWGTGLKLENEKNAERGSWSGLNLTGETLMVVRNELQQKC
jgi:ribA/ribD-fused uncharacterized protein